MGMDVLQTTDKLVGKHQDCFERELATTEVEEVFQARTEQIKHHSIILALSHIGVNSRNTSTTRKRSIDFSFTFEEGRIDGYMFKFDGNLVTRVHVGSLCAVSESQEVVLIRRIYYYQCIQRQSYHPQSSIAAGICRPHVNPKC